MNELRGRRFLPKIMTVIVALMMLIPSAAFADSTTDGIEQNYKPTASLTEVDKDYSVQKNYQKNANATSEQYLYKTAEWTDKVAGKAKITLTAKLPKQEKTKSVAVYAYTTCNYHGFSEEIARNNIEYLQAHYDQVDVITCYNVPRIDIDVKDPSDVLNSTDYASSRHHSFLVYQGLYDYLMGATPGQEKSTDTQVKHPTCIYTSFDAFAGISSTNMYQEGYQYDCWNILKKYKIEGRYFAMGQSHFGGTKFLSIHDKLLPTMGGLNALVGLMDPTLFPGIDSTTYWDGTTDYKLNHFVPLAEAIAQYGEKNSCLRTDVTTDYKYDDTFEAFEVPMVNNLQLSDQVSSEFEITKVSTTSSDSVSTSISGNSVIASLDEYKGTEPVTVTINVQLKDTENQANLNKWLDTNKDKAVVSYIDNQSGSSTIMDVTSPKLAYNKNVNQEKYTITTEVENGTIDQSITDITKGDSKTINYTPKEGFELKSVTVDGETVDIATYPEKYEFKEIDANHAIKVVYEPKAVAVEKYTITTEVENGTIDQSITDITKGDSKTINYTPKEGFELKSVTVNGETVDIATYPEKYEFKNIAANHNIKVVYEPKAVEAEKYTITTEVVNGTIDQSITDITKNDSKTINYSPAEGFELKSVTVDGETVDIATYPEKYEFKNIAANHNIKVVYEPKAVEAEKYTITTEVVNGTIDQSITDITKNDSKTINYSPAEGFELKSVTVDGQAVDIATYPNKYEFKDIAANHAIKVIYEKKAEPQEDKYTISTEVLNGRIDSSITDIPKNDSKTINYSPAEGFELKSVTVDGQAVDIATYPNKYEFKDIAANHAIKVVYEPKAVAAEKYTITTEVVNGSIDPSITNIAKNDNKTIEYSPKEGFKLMSVTVDSKTVDIATYPDKYDFEKINADHAIKVVYEKKAVVKEDPTNPGSDPGENNPTEDTDNAVQTGEDTGMILLSILLGTMAAIAATAVAVRRKTTR